MHPNYPATILPATQGGATATVLRNTYLMLGLTLIPTVIGAMLGVTLPLTIGAQHPFLALLVFMVISFGLIWGIQANKDNALGVVTLLAFTFWMGLMLGPILQVALHLKHGASMVALAAGGTGLIFVGLASVAAITKKDFSFLGNMLWVGLLTVIVLGFANMFLHLPLLFLALSAVSIVLFSGYILMDVSKVVNGGETNYVMATLSLYLSIYNIFINLLSILLALNDD
jgi:FtsH-binding integral membrane protein